MFYVYRFFNTEDDVIYVGKTNNMDVRMYQHFNKGHLPVKAYEEVVFIDYTALDNKTDQHLLEVFLINKYSPKYNTVDKYNEQPTLSFAMPTFKVYKDFRYNDASIVCNKDNIVIVNNVVPIYKQVDKQNKNVDFWISVVKLKDIGSVYERLTYNADAQRGKIDGKPVISHKHIKNIKKAMLNYQSIRGNLTWNAVKNVNNLYWNKNENRLYIKDIIHVPDSWHRHSAIYHIWKEDPNSKILDTEMVLHIYNLNKNDERKLFVNINAKNKRPNNNRLLFLADTKTAQFTRDLINKSKLKGRVETVRQAAYGNNITKFSTLHDALFGDVGSYNAKILEDKKTYNKLLTYLISFVDELLNTRKEFAFADTEERQIYKSQTMILEEIMWWGYFHIAKRLQESSIKDWRNALYTRMNSTTTTPQGRTVDFWSKQDNVMLHGSLLKMDFDYAMGRPIVTGSCINSNTTRRAVKVLIDTNFFLNELT